VRYIALMRALRPTTLSALLVSAWLLSGCATPAPAQAPAPTPEPPQPGPSSSAGATPTLGSGAPPVAAAPTGEEKPAETVDIRGRVIQARRNGQGEPPVGTLQVEGTLEPGTRYDKATVHVGHTTRIYLKSGKPASFSFVHSGDLVEVTFAGPVEESSPVKATAARIVILEHIP
jgi:hypothetical protein